MKNRSSKVLESLKQSNLAKVQPFALQSQYVPNILAAREGSAGDGDEGGQDSKQNKPNVPKGSQVSKGEKRPSEWQYASVRKAFLQSRRDEGHTFDDAVKLWDNSVEKAAYLAPCSIGELKKRRFLPAGSDHNPWFERIHGPTK